MNPKNYLMNCLVDHGTAVCNCMMYTPPFVGRQPYICPKCNGEGTEDGSKRMALDNKTVMNCWPCSGTGIVWG